MQPHSEAPTQLRRPFAGFLREAETFETIKPTLIATSEGKFIVIVGDAYVGPVDTYGDALFAGYRQFGPGPLYVKQLLAERPVAEISRDVHPCRP